MQSNYVMFIWGIKHKSFYSYNYKYPLQVTFWQFTIVPKFTHTLCDVKNMFIQSFYSITVYPAASQDGLEP